MDGCVVKRDETVGDFDGRFNRLLRLSVEYPCSNLPPYSFAAYLDVEDKVAAE